MDSGKLAFLFLCAPLLSSATNFNPLVLIWEEAVDFSHRLELMDNIARREKPEMEEFLDHLGQALGTKSAGEEEYLLSQLLEACRRREEQGGWNFTEANRSALVRLLATFPNHRRTELKAALLPFSSLLSMGERTALLMEEAIFFRNLLVNTQGILPPPLFIEVQRWFEEVLKQPREPAMETEVLRLHEVSQDPWLSSILKVLLNRRG